MVNYGNSFQMHNIQKVRTFALQKKRKDLSYGKIKHSNGD